MNAIIENRVRANATMPNADAIAKEFIEVLTLIHLAKDEDELLFLLAPAVFHFFEVKFGSHSMQIKQIGWLGEPGSLITVMF